MMVLLFVGTPIVSMSYTVIKSSSQLTEEEYSEEDSSEEETEDVLKILISTNILKFIQNSLELKIVGLNSQMKNVLPADIFIPPPELK
jgi:hypothetical protein